MTTTNPSQRAALIVCGGQSRRMGQAKPHLPFGNEAMLERVVRIVAPFVEEVVLLTAKVQELPPLSQPHTLVADRVEQQGPAAAIFDGWKCVQGWADAMIVLGCDLPLITAPTIELLFGCLEDWDAIMPKHDGFPQPLAAVYSSYAMPKFGKVLDSGNARLLSCIEALDTCFLSAKDIAKVDSKLGILHNVNTPEAYREALQLAGLKHPLDG